MFTLIGAAGIGAQTSSLVITLFCVVATGAVLSVVVGREEAFLRGKFGAAFEEYAVRVPRFIPRFAAYRDVAELVVQPKVIYRTFLESSYFLVAIPAFDMVEVLREQGWIPELLHLP